MSKDPYLKRLESLFSTVEPVEPEPTNGKAAPPSTEINGLRARVAELEASLARVQKAAEERDQSTADTLRTRIAELEASLAETHAERERSADQQMQAQQRADLLSAQVVELESKLGVAQAQVAVSGSLQAEAQSRVEFLQSRVSQLEIALSQSQNGQAALGDTDLIKFKLGIERSSDAIFITDPNGNIIFTNPAFEKVYGFTREEAIGRTPRIIKSGVIPPEGYQQFWSTLLSKNTVTGEIVNKTKDGRLVTIEGSNNPILDEAGNIIGFLAIHRDITERKRSEEALARVTHRSELILSSAGEGIFGLDADGNHTFVNEAAARTLGYTVDELIGRPSHITWHHTKPDGSHYPPEECPIYATLRDGETHSGPEYFWRKDGTGLPVEFTSTPLRERGKLEGAVVTFRDVTERKRAEAAIREREEDLAILLEFSPEAVGVVNTRTGLFENVNAAAEWLFGMPRDELVKVGPAQMSPDFQPDGRRSTEKAAEKIREALSGGTPVFEWAHRNTAGRIIPCEVRLVGLTGARSHLVRFSVTDITQRKLAEAMLSRRVSELEALNSIGQIMASQTDLNSMLTMVGDRICQTFGVNAGYIAIYNSASGMIEIPYHLDEGRLLPAPPRPLGQGLTSQVIKSRQPLLIRERAAERADEMGAIVYGSSDIQSWLGVPIFLGDDVVGIVNVQHSQPGRFDEDNVRLLTTIAASLGQAIQTARLAEQTRKRATELAMVAQVSTHAATLLNPEELLQQVVDQTKSSFALYHAHIYLLNEPGDELVLTAGAGEVGRQMVAAGRTIPLAQERSLVARAARERRGVIVNDVHADPGFLPHPLLPNTRAELAVPMIVGDRVLGVFDVQSDSANRFTDEDVRIQTTLAEQAAVALQNARSYDQTNRALKELASLTRRLTREGWEDYTTEQASRLGYEYDLNQVTALPVEQESTRSLESARAVESALRVRGETIGHLIVTDVERADAEVPEIVAAVADRLSAHIENLRLTEQALAARQTQEQQAGELRALFAAMEDVVLVFSAEGRYLRIAPTNPSLLYRPPQELLGRTMHDVMPKQLADTLVGYIRRALAEGQTLRAEYNLPIGDNDVWFEAAVSPLTSNSVFWVARDITQRKQTEAALSKRAVELEAIARVSAAASSILDTDVLLQTVVDLTKSLFNLYHAHIYLLNETGDMLELVSGAGATGRLMVAESRHIPFNAEHSLVARAAQTRQAVVANNVQQERGFLPHPLLPNTRSELAIPMVVGDLLLGVFDVQADVIDRFTEDDVRLKIALAEQVAVALQNARLYAEQAATVERLRELDQLKSSFLANMSHELRTPLNSILGFTQVLLEGIDGDINERMENDLIIVQKNGQHLLNLISDILDMAKIEAGKMTLNPEIFDLKDVLDEVIDIASPLARVKSLDLLLDTSGDAAMDINADRMRLRQVMINIVNNAIKFTDSGYVSIQAERSNGHIRIRVHDTGIGINASHIETIFQEFSQVDSSTTRKVGGTGLGLPISRHLIELHGGRLWAESTGVPGEGSTFIIELPVETTFNENA